MKFEVGDIVKVVGIFGDSEYVLGSIGIVKGRADISNRVAIEFPDHPNPASAFHGCSIYGIRLCPDFNGFWVHESAIVLINDKRYRDVYSRR